MYFTPGEILKRNPQIKWRAQEMGYLLKLGLVDGKKTLRGCYLEESQVIGLHEQRIRLKAV